MNHSRDRLWAQMFLKQWANPEVIDVDEARRARAIENQMGENSIDPLNYERVLRMLKNRMRC